MTSADNDNNEILGSGSLATNQGVAAGEGGQAAGENIYNYTSHDASGNVIAVVAITVVGLVIVFTVTLFLLERPGKPITSISQSLLTPAATRTLMPTPTIFETLTGLKFQDALHLMGNINLFIRNELEGHHQFVDETMWCQKHADLEKLRQYLAQQGPLQGVFFTYHENPVMGEENCFRLWSKYVKGLSIEKDGVQVCTVERWAYLPEEKEKQITAFVNVSMCYLDVTEEKPCLRNCSTFNIWYNDYIARNQWNDIREEKAWPTPVSEIR